MSNLWAIRREEYPLPPIAKSYKGEIAVCGSGASIWDDLEKVPGYDRAKWQQPFDIMTINDMGMHLPHRLEHWYSNDGWLKYWITARRPYFYGQAGNRGGRHEAIKYHAWDRIGGIEGLNVWGWPGSGTSSLNGCLTALGLGYEKIWLCGVPLNNGPHYFDPPWMVNNFDNSHERRAWEHARDTLFAGKVVSLSGNTKVILDA